VTQWFKGDDRAIILLGETSNDLGASEYAVAMLGGIEVACLTLTSSLNVECKKLA